MIVVNDEALDRQLTHPQRTFLEQGVMNLQKDPRIVGVAIGGSFLLDEMDAFSDLDLVLYFQADKYEKILNERESLARGMGDLLESFTGEHVGEPRLLICVYGPPLLHVDLKFVSLDDIEDKVENPVVLWERDTALSKILHKTEASFPQPNPEWIEKRVWVWVHYTATKIGRGELFEAIEALGFLRNRVLGPLLLKKYGKRPQGQRKLEQVISPEELEIMKACIPGYSAESCRSALKNVIILYRSLRGMKPGKAIERLACEYLDEVKTN
jgi:predicted nucleotidyltransferase